jgi:hypothetical protein
MTSDTHHPVRIDVSAAMFAAAALCRSEEETRYYLQGVHIRPSPKGGVVIEATDGRIGFAAHDPNGSTDRPVIVCPGDDLLSALNPKPAAWETDPDDPDTRYQLWKPAMQDEARLRGQVDRAATVLEIYATDRDQHLAAAGSAEILDGDFPNLPRIVPDNTKGGHQAAFAAWMLERAAQAAIRLNCGYEQNPLQFAFGEPDAPAICRIASRVGEAILIMMPMRSTVSGLPCLKSPEWLPETPPAPTGG